MGAKHSDLFGENAEPQNSDLPIREYRPPDAQQPKPMTVNSDDVTERGNMMSKLLEKINTIEEQNGMLLKRVNDIEMLFKLSVKQGVNGTADVQNEPCPNGGVPPQEIIKNHLPDLISEMDGQAILPHLASFFTKDEVSRIEATTERHARNDQIIQGIWRHFLDVSDNHPPCYVHFLKVLAGLHPELYVKLQDREPTDEEADFCMEEFVRELKKTVLEQGHTLDRFEDREIDMDRNYLQLELAAGHGEPPANQSLLFDSSQVPGYYQAHLDRSISTDKSTPERARLFPSHFPYMQRNLLTGRAGIGKSTTVQWLLRQWAKSIWAKEFTIIFLIPVRLLLTCGIRTSLSELLTKYTLYRTEKHTWSLLSTQWLRHNNVRIMLQMDGIDEIKDFSVRMRDTPIITDLEEKAHPLDLCVNILRGNLLSDCTLLCTSRHFLGLRYLQECKRFEILGLSQDGVKSYIDNVFPDKSEQIKSVLVRNPVLMSICAITFYCTVICRLLYEDQSLSETDVMTYTRLQCFIMKKFASRNIKESTFSLEGLEKLAKLAFNGIFNTASIDDCAQIVFTEEDLIAVGIGADDQRMAVTRGLLLSHDKNLQEDAKFEFFHLSAQELFSAGFLLSNHDMDDDTYEQTLKRVPIDGRFDMVLLYLFGLCFDHESPWVQRTFSAISHGDSPAIRFQEGLRKALLKLIQDQLEWYWMEFDEDMGDFLYLIHQGAQNSVDKLRLCLMAHESQEPDIAKKIMPTVIVDEKLVLEWCLVTAIDMMALIFTCRHAENLREISLKQANIDDTSTKILAEFLASNQTVTFLDLSCNQVKADGLLALSQMLRENTTLEKFVLDSNKIEDRDMQHLLPGLCVNQSLRQVSLSDNCISDKTIQVLAAHDDLFTRWTHLKLDKNFITHIGADMLITKAREFGMEYGLLDLSNNFISVEKVMSGLEPKVRMNRGNVDYDHVLQKCKTSKVIRLSEAGITDEDMKVVATCIIGHENVEEIYLENNKLTALSLALLSTFAFTCPKLLHIYLEGNHIDSHTVGLFRHMHFREEIGILTIRRGTEDLLMLGDWKHVIYIPYGMDTRWLNGLASVLQETSSLLEFRFLSSRLKSFDSKVMADILNSSSALYKLAIAGIIIKDWSLLTHAILNMTQLVSLSIKDCQLTNTCAELILQLLPQLPRLTSFELSGSGAQHIDPETVSQVCETLRHNHNLKHLCLDDQPLGDRGAMQIASALKENMTLKTLRLNACQIGAQGGNAIGEALLMNSTLETLELRGNTLGVDVVRDFYNKLNGNTNIQSLCLD